MSMVGEYGYKCLKFMVVFFNLLFWFVGCVLFGLGIWLLGNKGEVVGDYIKVVGLINYEVVFILCVVIGVVIIVVVFMVCCGVIKEN